MKVAFITNAFPVLYNSFTANEIAKLVEQGVDVSVFALRRHKGLVLNEVSVSLSSRAHYFHDFLNRGNNRLKTFLLSHPGRLRRWLPKVYDILGRMLFEKRKPSHRDEGHQRSLGWYWYALEPIADFLRRNNFDLIHAGFGNWPAEAAMLLARSSGLPFTFEAHAFDLFVDFPFPREKLREASRIFTISEYNRDYMVRNLGGDHAQIEVMRVPIDRKHCDKVLGRLRDPDLLVSVCRLHPIKGLDQAIEAVARVARKRPRVRLTIVGDGPLMPMLVDKARSLGIVANVTFLGSRSSEEALDLIARASIFVLPSVIAPNGDRDGIPTSLIEAMYLQTPVISTRVSGIPELIDDGVNGFLVEPGDVEALAERIETLLANNELRAVIAEKGREKVDRGFYTKDSAHILKEHWEAIRRCRLTAQKISAAVYQARAEQYLSEKSDER